MTLDKVVGGTLGSPTVIKKWGGPILFFREKYVFLNLGGEQRENS